MDRQCGRQLYDRTCCAKQMWERLRRPMNTKQPRRTNPTLVLRGAGRLGTPCRCPGSGGPGLGAGDGSGDATFLGPPRGPRFPGARTSLQAWGDSVLSRPPRLSLSTAHSAIPGCPPVPAPRCTSLRPTSPPVPPSEPRARSCARPRPVPLSPALLLAQLLRQLTRHQAGLDRVEQWRPQNLPRPRAHLWQAPPTTQVPPPKGARAPRPPGAPPTPGPAPPLAPSGRCPCGPRGLSGLSPRSAPLAGLGGREESTPPLWLLSSQIIYV